jgi:hypothetical protein
MERWSQSITKDIPQAWGIITKTVDPIIYATLIKLMGSNSHFDKESGSIVPILDADKCIKGFSVTQSYVVPGFRGCDADNDAIQEDTQYVLTALSQVKQIKVSSKSVKIDVKGEKITISYAIPV